MGFPLAQMPGQVFRLRGEDDVGGFLAHVCFHQRDGHVRQVTSEGLKTLEQGLVQGAEKARDTLHVENMNQLVHRPIRHVRSKGLVRELRQGHLVAWIVNHPVELDLLTFLLGRLQLARLHLHPAREMHGPFSQRLAGKGREKVFKQGVFHHPWTVHQ